MKKLITILLMSITITSAFAQTNTCEPFRNTTDNLKKWTYKGTELRRIKFKEAVGTLSAVNDPQVNVLLSKSKGLRGAGQALTYTGLAVALTGAVMVTTVDIKTGLTVAIPGLALEIVGAILSSAGKSKFKQSILRYNEVCEMRIGMASQSLGPGLYITLK